ncbi:MAG: hypothetical protein MZV70_52555 [Desulfobacterales bacterium]|nr:hypothetical protein [Desulfobacterales bacterium]
MIREVPGIHHRDRRRRPGLQGLSGVADATRSSPAGGRRSSASPTSTRTRTGSATPAASASRPLPITPSSTGSKACETLLELTNSHSHHRDPARHQARRREADRPLRGPGHPRLC